MSRDPHLAQQLRAIDRLPFSRELRDRMKVRAVAIWYRDNATDAEEFGVDDYSFAGFGTRDAPERGQMTAQNAKGPTRLEAAGPCGSEGTQTGTFSKHSVRPARPFERRAPVPLAGS